MIRSTVLRRTTDSGDVNVDWGEPGRGFKMQIECQPKLIGDDRQQAFLTLFGFLGHENYQQRKKMRNLFRKVAAVSTAFALISGAAVAADVDGPELIWNVSLWGKPRAFTAGAEELAALVSEKTDGNWEIKLHYGLKQA